MEGFPHPVYTKLHGSPSQQTIMSIT